MSLFSCVKYFSLDVYNWKWFSIYRLISLISKWTIVVSKVVCNSIGLFHCPADMCACVHMWERGTCVGVCAYRRIKNVTTSSNEPMSMTCIANSEWQEVLHFSQLNITIPQAALNTSLSPLLQYMSAQQTQSTSSCAPVSVESSYGSSMYDLICEKRKISISKKFRICGAAPDSIKTYLASIFPLKFREFLGSSWCLLVLVAHPCQNYMYMSSLVDSSALCHSPVVFHKHSLTHTRTPTHANTFPYVPHARI